MSQLIAQKNTLETLEASIKAMQAAAEVLKAAIEASKPKLLMPPARAPTPSKVWSVHDCHSHLKKNGIWAAGAVTNGNYGICVGPSEDSKDSSNTKVEGPKGEVIVSKRRWNDAKGISVGDTLFMGDTHLKKVFKGLVTEQPVKGPFCSLASKENSFLCALEPQTEERLRREVEIVFKVIWEEVAPLTDEWKDYLGTARRLTVMPIKTAPPV